MLPNNAVKMANQHALTRTLKKKTFSPIQQAVYAVTKWRKSMNTEQEFYICLFCFCASETNDQCHERAMTHYPGFPTGDARLKPLMAESGEIKTRMPRWMLKE